MSEQKLVKKAKENNQDIAIILEQNTEKALKAYANDIARFNTSIDKVANGSYGRGYTPIGRTPDVLKILGVPDTKVIVKEQHLEKVMATYLGISDSKYETPHNITPENLRKIPSEIHNPIAVFKSSTRANSYLALTEQYEQKADTGKNSPIAVIFNVNAGKDEIDIINIGSIYGRSQSQLIRDFTDNLLYVNTQKGQKFLNTERLQLPWDFTSDKSNLSQNYKTEKDLSQYILSKNIEKEHTQRNIQEARPQLLDDNRSIENEQPNQNNQPQQRAKQLISAMARPLNQSERANGNGREIPSGSSQESHTQQGRSSSPVSQAHTPNLKPTLEQIQERVVQARQSLISDKEISNADQTQAHHTEQRAIHQASTIDSRTTSRVDSLQSARSQVLQGSNQDTQQNHQSLSDKPTYIKCPYSEKNQAKALGAKWDGDNKLWYVPAGLDLTKFEKWLTPDRQTSQSKPQTTVATQSDERIYLYTQPSDNDALQQLKRQGIIKFDPPLKLWYANKTNVDAVKQWTIRPNMPTAEQALGEHLRNLGINVEAGHPIIDGRPHRLANDGSKDKNVMYHAYPNDGGVPYARITNFSRGGVSEWTYPTEHLLALKAIEAVDRATGKKTAPSKTNHQPTQSSYTKQASQTTPKDTALENKMAERAKMLMSFAPIAPSTQKYLNDKKVTANDVARIVPSSDQIPKELEPFIAIGNTPSQYFWLQSNNPEGKLVLQRGSLVIPQTNAQGEIRAFETIAYNGKKYAQKDAQKSGLSTALGHLKNGNPIVIAEGYATGATLHENTGQAVVVAFGKNGLMQIAQELRDHFPDSKIYIGADNDHNKTLNAGLLDAKAVEEAVPDTYVLVPTFNQGDTGKDWNDVFVDKGVDEFKRQLKEQLTVINPQQAQSNKTVQNQVQPAPTQNPLDPDSIRQNHPTMSDDNIKSVQLWQKEIARRYADKPHHQALALERLVNKLSDYANGEILTPPKSCMAKMQPPKATPEQPQTKPSQDSQTQVANNKSTTR